MPACPLPPVSSPQSILAIIPVLLGLEPEASLVVIGADESPSQVQAIFRYDLHPPTRSVTVAKIAAHATGLLARNQLRVAAVVAYGPGPRIAPAADAVAGELRRAGVTLHDRLCVQDGRYWSSACHGPDHCPEQGVPLRLDGQLAAQLLAAGDSDTLRSRAALAATIAPATGPAAESMRQATVRAERRISEAAPRRHAMQQAYTEGLRAVRVAVAAYRRGGQITSDDQIARLAVPLTDLRVRDHAWAHMIPGHRAAHGRLWTDVVRRVPARYIPAPASLLAFTAWQEGNGSLASIAAERALAADPQYAMALVIVEALGAGAPPSAARPPLPAEGLQTSHANQDPDR